MASHLNTFRELYLNARSWELRREGVPLDLLDNLSPDELTIAENELIKCANPSDSWPVIGLGHIKSTKALPTLYKILDHTRGGMLVIVAHAIFQINGDIWMTEIVLNEVPRIKEFSELIPVLGMLNDFRNKRISALLDSHRFHKDYLVAYNATAGMGLPTDEVVAKFAKKEKWKRFWKTIFG